LLSSILLSLANPLRASLLLNLASSSPYAVRSARHAASSLRKAMILRFLLLTSAAGFSSRSRPRHPTLLQAKTLQRKWQTERTKLADDPNTIKDSGLAGAIQVRFKQGNATKMTRAEVGTPLSEVASQADQFIRYKCKKGECGTCEVQVNGKWVRTCVSTVPYVEDVFEVTVKPTMMKGQGKASKFYSVKSFIMGWYNNILGMVGFVKTSATEGKNFRDRLDGEDEVARLVAERKAARLAEGKH
jgi:hypothetical protein